MDILNSIKNNEIRVLYLREAPMEYFGDDYNVEDFVDALSNNKSIHTVRFKQDFLGCHMGENRLAVVSALGRLKNVQSIELGHAGVQLPQLIRAIAEAKSLKFLMFETVVFQGLPHEFDILESTLQSHPSLKRVTITGCYPSFEEIDLNKLVEAGNYANSANKKKQQEKQVTWAWEKDHKIPPTNGNNNAAEDGEDDFTEVTADNSTSMHIADHESEAKFPLIGCSINAIVSH